MLQLLELGELADSIFQEYYMYIYYMYIFSLKIIIHIDIERSEI